MPHGALMPRIVVDVSEETCQWLQSQQGQWKPRTAVLREIIDQAMRQQQLAATSKGFTPVLVDK
jgi:hypothetical protein